MPIDFIEILFAEPNALEIEITQETIDAIKGKRILVHTPFYQYTKEIIQKTIAQAKRLGAEHIVIHPDYIIDVNILKERDVIFALENIKSFPSTLLCGFHFENFAALVDQIPVSIIVLDIGHAIQSGGEEEVIKYLDAYNQNIAACHVKKEQFTLSCMKLPFFSKIPLILEGRCKNREELINSIEEMKNISVKQRNNF